MIIKTLPTMFRYSFLLIALVITLGCEDPYQVEGPIEYSAVFDAPVYQDQEVELRLQISEPLFVPWGYRVSETVYITRLSAPEIDRILGEVQYVDISGRNIWYKFYESNGHTSIWIRDDYPGSDSRFYMLY